MRTPILSLGLFLGLSSPSTADVIFENFVGDGDWGNNGWSISGVGTNGQMKAFSFTPLSSHILQTVDVPVSSGISPGTSPQFSVGIYADVQGAPGALLSSGTATAETVPFPWIPTTATTVQMSPQAALQGGQRYWIGLHPASSQPTDLGWSWNSSGTESPFWGESGPDGCVLLGCPWTLSGVQTESAFRLEGIPTSLTVEAPNNTWVAAPAGSSPSFTVNATATPSGGTFEWVAGPKLVVESAQDGTAVLRATSPSAAPSDASFTVTYSYNGAVANSLTLDLTVQRPCRLRQLGDPQATYPTLYTFQLFNQFGLPFDDFVGAVPVDESIVTVSSNHPLQCPQIIDQASTTTTNGIFQDFLDLDCTPCLFNCSPFSVPNDLVQVARQRISAGGWVVSLRRVTYFGSFAESKEIGTFCP